MAGRTLKLVALACHMATFAMAKVVSQADARRTLMKYDCEECIERSRHKIKAILHGTTSDGFWKQMSSAMLQAGKDMRTDLDLDLYKTFDEDQMVSDIVKATDEFMRNDMPPLNTILVVTIPTLKVKAAVSRAISAGMPVFGVNNGCNFAKDLPLLGCIAMDDYVAGSEAAREFLSHTNVTKALYINHAKENAGLEQRRIGFTETLEDHSKIRGERFFSNDDDSRHVAHVRVDELGIDMRQDSFSIQSRLNRALEGCTYDVVLLAGAGLLEHTTSAYYHNSCKLDGKHQLLGSFDTDSKVYDAIALGKLAFTISQQQYLQGAFTIVLASIYSTTGQHPAPSGGSPFGTYLAGPKVLGLANLPTDTQQRCEAESFPICSSRSAGNSFYSDQPSESKCGCIDRRNIKIGGVLYGPKFAPFWRPLWAAAKQAALDVDVKLRLDSLEGPDEHFEDKAGKVGSKMKSLCDEGVDGIFAPVKSDDVVEAIAYCKNLSVPVLSLNSGAEISEGLGTIQHISQIEYRGGFVAGERMVAAGLRVGYCVNWAPTNDLDDRCFGFRDAILAGNVNATYGGVLSLPSDNLFEFKSKVETNMTYPNDWEGVGFLLAGFDFLKAALSLKKDHPRILLGTFDLNDLVYDAIEDGNLLFGIDQQPYLQGYLPVTLLTWFAYAKQSLHHHFMETGPHLIETAPSVDKKTCEAKFFEVCREPDKYHKHQLGRVRPVGLAIASIIFLCSILFAIWVAVNRENRVVKASQPIFLLSICVGTCTMAGSIVPMSLDDGVLRDDGGCLNCECKRCDIACMAAPWLVSLGFSLIFASLFSKIWRVNKLEKGSRRFRRIAVSARDVALPLLLLLVLDVSIMLLWTFVDPMHWQRTRRCGSDQFTSYGSCTLGRGSVALGCATSIMAVNLVAVVLANFQAVQAREIPTAYSESAFIAMAMASILQVMMVGAPLLFLVKDNPPAMFFVQTGIVSIICMSVLLFIFVPKMNAVRQKEPPKTSSHCDVSTLAGGGTAIDFSASLRRRSLADIDVRTKALLDIPSQKKGGAYQGLHPTPPKDGKLLTFRLSGVEDGAVPDEGDNRRKSTAMVESERHPNSTKMG